MASFASSVPSFKTSLFLVLCLLLFTCARIHSSPLPNEETEGSTESPTDHINLSTDDITETADNASTEQLESRENNFDELTSEQDKSSTENSTESRYNIRDFYRRRQQKHVETLNVDNRALLRVAKNQTASEILMQKIRQSKEQQKNYFDPAAPGVENSISQKRKRLVRVRPKFNELAAAASTTTPSLVKAPSPSPLPSATPAPPLIAATNTLLMWNENKTNLDFPAQGVQPLDWSRKKAAASSIIRSRFHQPNILSQKIDRFKNFLFHKTV